MRSTFYVITQNMPTNEANYKNPQLFALIQDNFFVTDTKLPCPRKKRGKILFFVNRCTVHFDNVKISFYQQMHLY
jgi:hypothetical protein